jgi:hypothetical protein
VLHPSEDQIRQFAYELWEKRGQGHGFAVADWLMARQALTLPLNYDLLLRAPFIHDRKIVLRDQEQKCRFCGNCKPQATFRNVAHAVPELLGNKAIVAEYECDRCNEDFGKRLENDLGNMTSPLRVVTHVRGKSGPPTYKSRSKKSRIETIDDVTRVNVGDGDNLVNVDREKGEVTLYLRSHVFSPLMVLKALTKIALMLMPEEEFQYFPNAVAWISNIGSNHVPYAPANCFCGFTPGPFPKDFGSAWLFRRKGDAHCVPYMMLVLQVANMTFQIPVPFCNRDFQLAGKRAQVPFFPSGLWRGYDFGEPTFDTIDLASTNPTTKEYPVVFQTQNMVYHPPPPQTQTPADRSMNA